MGRQFSCAVGRSGITGEKREGDGATPAGVWRLTGGAWRADRGRRPVAALRLTKIGPNDLWSDDPAHAGYNRAHRAVHPDFGYERMRRGDGLYDIVLFSDWNTEPARPGDGSAIFVHCWKAPRRPTAGCVAFSRADLCWILRRWRRDSRVIVQP